MNLLTKAVNNYRDKYKSRGVNLGELYVQTHPLVNKEILLKTYTIQEFIRDFGDPKDYKKLEKAIYEG
jgi:O-glycosyl hydrolase